MALGDDYVTAAELKGEFRIGDTDDDTELALAIGAASEWVNRWCHRDFNNEGSATARTFYPSSYATVMVDDISTTSGLVVKTDSGNDGSYEETWASTDYILEPLNQVVDGTSGYPYTLIRSVESRRFPHTRRPSVQVTANWGWPAVPDAVKKATMIMAARIYKRRDSATGILAGFGEFGPVRVGARLDPDVEALLNPYRRDPIPAA